MRLLHTGDWHVGRTIRGRSRAEEFADALREVVGIAREEAVDAVLLAGDVYDHRSPTPEADALVFEALVRLYEASIPVVAIPGNHDAASRLGALAQLLRPIGVVVVPRVVPPSDGSLVEVASRDGSEIAQVACLPFVPERRFGDAAALFRATEAWYQSYAEGMGRLIEAMCEPFRPDRVNVLLGHLFTDGAIPGGGEHQITIGIEYAVSPSRLPATASYVALGHVHRPQAVRGAPSPARYAGSLLQLDFGEREQTKSVAIVEAHPGVPAKVREVALSAGRRLVDVRGTVDEVLAKGRGLPDAHLRVEVLTQGPVPGLNDRVRDELPNAVDVRISYERVEAEPAGPPISSLASRDQFISFYRTEHGVDQVSAEVLDAFDEVAELEGA
ncbi:MAG: exonuclease SbcCD subunit D [Deltaproteobacteria bacterium]|nr:MAG: exonuclease SbcCD subunit D [Deltaproteobacteria bacterium]